MKPLRCLTDLPVDGFEQLATDWGQRPFAGRNLRRWVYERRSHHFSEMTDLSGKFRGQLSEATVVRSLGIHSRREDDGGTTAFLLQLDDGQRVETVLIPEGDRNTVCVSTQVGCAVACVFCASGMKGLRRNLRAGEIVEQVMLVQESLPETERVTNVVVMGIGEPTMNFAALCQALETWNHPDGLGLGARRITISTVGYPNKIDQLASLGKEFGLAVSLHAPRQDLREQLLPGAGKVPLPDLLAAARRYYQKTHRRVTFEYVLLDGINAFARDAEQLCQLLRGFPCFVNLIPMNPVDGLPYRRPPAEMVNAFRNILEQSGIEVTQRKTRGDGIAAACGQLRLREEDAEATEVG